jgi:hypothetical protein
VRVQIAHVADAIDALKHALDEQVSSAVWRLSNAIAQSARDSHTFTNRTGRLEGSIAASMSSGTFMRDSLSGGVTAGRPYGEFLEEGTLDEHLAYSTTVDGEQLQYGPWSFLTAALVREEAAVNGWLEHGLQQAAHEAGW